MQQKQTTKKQHRSFLFHWGQNLDQSFISIEPGTRGRLCWLALKAGKYEEDTEFLSCALEKSTIKCSDELQSSKEFS